MTDGCIGNCLACGKCNQKKIPILDCFRSPDYKPDSRDGFGIAVDIGTTTVVLLLIELSTGKIVARHSFQNPQRAYGADVISRMSFANNGGLKSLHRSITDAVSAGIRSLVSSYSQANQLHAEIVIAGNTTMIHLLLELSCESLGVFPFQPVVSLKDMYTYPEVFGTSEWECSIRIVTWFSAFVGGDVAAGILHAMSEGSQRFLLVDLGTNGELALYDDGNLFVTSTAAGPAFEGGNHAGGASAVLEDLARMVRQGCINNSGALAADAPPVFTQKEVRDLQLAKAAVRTGVETLLEAAGIGYSGLDAVYLAGGIGQAINVDSAVAIGLLPAELHERVSAIGNASLGGAALLLLSPDSLETISKLIASAESINLSEHPRFNDRFVEYLSF